MMHVLPDRRLTEREAEALERNRQKAELIMWLRREAAARDGEMAWYVARTNWRADSVANELWQHGIEAVCPKERRWKRFPRSNRRYSVDIPLFGNYLFVRLLKAESAWSGVLTFEGVQCLQGRGDRPVPIAPREEVQLLVMLAGTVAASVPAGGELAVGDKVVRPIGSFAELVGTVREIDDAKRQALISTMLFGREVETRCGIDDLEKL
ncbi:transcription termination/antitermination protein NusG [Chelativorans oligotrophicus]|uniref:transcription termination/antitermination protein NusG n=1 Tax=Chelativorans oligotrophicus TaxID=449974 RepID=UPI00140E7699|nr:transcription termination/antitermination NusG family protein [Chelativorans oligotrophicus]